jgi:hypothetical protein
MRKWEQALRRDIESWDDFLTWLLEQRQRELDRMLTVDASGHERQAGRVEAIDGLIYQARVDEREEQERARSGRSDTPRG